MKYVFFVFIFFILAVGSGLFLDKNIFFWNSNKASNTILATNSIKTFYSDYLYKSVAQSSDYAQKAEVLYKIIDLTPDDNRTYYEFCSNLNKYLSSSEDKQRLLKYVLTAYKKINNDILLNCYINALLVLSDYDNAIIFMQTEYEKILDPYQKGYLLEKIKHVKNEQNMLVLTSALDKYVLENKQQPQDISVLKDLGLVDKIPDDPFGGQYFIDKKGQIRSTSERSNTD